jgi:hypothetical protein
MGDRMKVFAGRVPLLAASLLSLSACVAPPVSQFAFDKHPGVFMEQRWEYGWGVDYLATYVVNRGAADKCVWTQYLDSRLLRAGETWRVSEMQSPGTIGVANVVPGDPNCTRAKSQYGLSAPRRSHWGPT